MKIAVFFNVEAGIESKNSAFTDDIRNSFSRYNEEVILINIYGKNLYNEINKAITEGIDIIAASGGDGTVSSVASYLKGENIPLAVIPSGTLNHFAKDLNIPLNLDSAVDNIFSGKITEIDAAEVNGRTFLNNSSIGIYPHAVRKRSETQKLENIGKWKAMFFALLHVFLRFPIYAVRINVDDNSEIIRSPFIFIGNNEYKMDFLSLGSRENLKKGVLSLFIAKTRTRFGIIKIISKLIFNYFMPFNIFEMMKVNKVKIESKKKRMHIAIDGEVILIEPPLEYRVHTKSLKVIVPRI